MKLDPLQCDSCGAPVPLADGELTTCTGCQNSVVIDPSYRELRRAAEAARRRRREAEAKLRALKKGPPAWVRWLYVRVLMPGGVLGVPVWFLWTQAEYGWYAREWVVLAGMLPFLVTLYFALVLDVWANPEPYIDALGIQLRPAPPRPDAVGLACGVCGAPLEVETDAYAATCDYCGADSWVRGGTGASVHSHVEGRDAANLADLMAVERFRSFDLKLFRIVYPVVSGLACVGLFFGLPGRAELEALNYARSVDYEWDLVGGHPGPVVDLAVLNDGLIAVGDDGQVQVYEDSEWRYVDGTEPLMGKVLGVGASGGRALLVGRGGAAAWYKDGDLERVDVGLTTDLHDVWLGMDQGVAVVGSGGEVALSAADGEAWWTKSVKDGPDFNAVWGWSLDELVVLGGVKVWTLNRGQWSSELLVGLPLVVGVSGDSRRVYVATVPLDGGESSSGDVFSRGRGQQEWDLNLFSGESYSALVVAADGLWVVGPQGFVQREHMSPLQAPGTGDLHAIVIWKGRVVVAGDDGVFIRRE